MNPFSYFEKNKRAWFLLEKQIMLASNSRNQNKTLNSKILKGTTRTAKHDTNQLTNPKQELFLTNTLGNHENS